MTKKMSKKAALEVWRLTSVLKRLKLQFSEYERGTERYYVMAPQFGLLFRSNPSYPPQNHFQDWDVIDVDFVKLSKDPNSFYEDLVWLLISKGYFAYLREPDVRGEEVYKAILFNGGWAKKIIDRRIKYWEADGAMKNRFNLELNKKVRDLPNSYVISNYPAFFDWLF